MWSNIPTNLVLSSVLIWLVGVDAVERGPWWLFANVLPWGRRGWGGEGERGTCLLLKRVTSDPCATIVLQRECHTAKFIWCMKHLAEPKKCASWDLGSDFCGPPPFYIINWIRKYSSAMCYLMSRPILIHLIHHLHCHTKTSQSLLFTTTRTGMTHCIEDWCTYKEAVWMYKQFINLSTPYYDSRWTALFSFRFFGWRMFAFFITNTKW